jgi:hypothetical protein
MVHQSEESLRPTLVGANPPWSEGGAVITSATASLKSAAEHPGVADKYCPMSYEPGISPTTCLTFLRIKLDSFPMEAWLPKDKLRCPSTQPGPVASPGPASFCQYSGCT